MWDYFGNNEDVVGSEHSFGTTETIPIKIVILGPSGVGKTTIGRAFRDYERFTPSQSELGESGRSHLPFFCNTCVADYFVKSIGLKPMFDGLDTGNGTNSGSGGRSSNFSVGDSTDGTFVSMTFWDTAGFEKFEDAPSPMLLNGANVVLLCFSMDDPNSIKNVVATLRYCQNSKVSDNCVYFCIGNKLDVYERLCRSALIKNLATTTTTTTTTTTRKINVAARSKNGDEERGLFEGDYFERYGGNHAVRSIAGCEGYEDVEKGFFAKAGDRLLSVANALKKSNSANECDDNNGEKVKYGNLLSFTTSFCTSKSPHNPVYCILYAVCVYLEKSGIVVKTRNRKGTEFLAYKRKETKDGGCGGGGNGNFSTLPYLGNGVIVLGEDTFLPPRDGGAPGSKEDGCCS